VLLVAVFLIGKPAPEQRYERLADGNATVIEWYQDTEHTIDLQQYFFDPDMDIINYSVSQPANIRASVQGTMLTLKPDEGFAGSNTMIVTATDSKGATAESPEFTLNVIGERNLSFQQCLNLWCTHIILVELLLLMLVLFLVLLTIKEYRPKPYAGNVLVVVSKTARKQPAKRVAKKSAKTARRTSRRAPAKAPAKRRAQTRAVATVRGRQVVLPRQPVVKEFKGSGQTVNIAVGNQAPNPTIVTVPGARQTEVVYVGSKAGDKVHTPYCIIARRIPKSKRVAFYSKREASNAGRVPCNVCRPFEGSI
jgi:hypothetical protein